MLTNGDENVTSLLFFPESKVKILLKKTKITFKKKNIKTYSDTTETNSNRINYENTRFPSTLNVSCLSKINTN